MCSRIFLRQFPCHRGHRCHVEGMLQAITVEIHCDRNTGCDVRLLNITEKWLNKEGSSVYFAGAVKEYSQIQSRCSCVTGQEISFWHGRSVLESPALNSLALLFIFDFSFPLIRSKLILVGLMELVDLTPHLFTHGIAIRSAVIRAVLRKLLRVIRWRGPKITVRW